MTSIVVTPRTHNFVRFNEQEEQDDALLGVRGRRTGLIVPSVMKDADGLENLEAFFSSGDEQSLLEDDNPPTPFVALPHSPSSSSTTTTTNRTLLSRRESFFGGFSPIVADFRKSPGFASDLLPSDDDGEFEESLNFSGPISPIALPNKEGRGSVNPNEKGEDGYVLEDMSELGVDEGPPSQENEQEEHTLRPKDKGRARWASERPPPKPKHPTSGEKKGGEEASKKRRGEAPKDSGRSSSSNKRQRVEEGKEKGQKERRAGKPSAAQEGVTRKGGKAPNQKGGKRAPAMPQQSSRHPPTHSRVPSAEGRYRHPTTKGDDYDDDGLSPLAYWRNEVVVYTVRPMYTINKVILWTEVVRPPAVTRTKTNNK